MSETPVQPDPERLIDDVETLKIYFDPLRLRLLSAMAGSPRTVNELAEEVGVPFTRLYYHMHLLEQHGLIRLVETRNISGAVDEKFYQVSARQFLVDRDLLRPGTPAGDDMLNLTLEATLHHTEADIRQSVYNGGVDASTYPPDPRSLLLRRGVTRLTPESARMIYEKLLAILSEALNLEAEESDREDARYYALLAALYPTLLPFDEDET